MSEKISSDKQKDPQNNELPLHRFFGSWWAEEPAIRLALTKTDDGQIRFEIIEQLQPHGMTVKGRATLPQWRCQQLIDVLKSKLDSVDADYLAASEGKEFEHTMDEAPVKDCLCRMCESARAAKM